MQTAKNEKSESMCNLATVKQWRLKKLCDGCH